MTTLPAYPVTTVGSWPRPSWLRQATKRQSKDLAELRDEATLLAIKYQEDAGVDLISDGEQRRDNFFSFVAEKLGGMKLMTLSELLDYVEDKAGFEALLGALDVPAFAIKNPAVTGKLSVERPLAVDDARFLLEHTRKPVKVTLPGPYLLSRSTWVKQLSEGAYPTREALADDVVQILRAELIALAELGVAMVQFDEPVLTELVFTGKAATRTFMCAALAASADPQSELNFAVELINRVAEGVSGPIVGLHVCRGNWSNKEEVLLEGGYEPLIPHLARMHAVDQFVLEYATPRAGKLEALRGLPAKAQLGFGVVNPRTAELEDPGAVAARAREVSELLGPERVFLNPDCGFGTFAERPVNDAQTAYRKLQVLSAAARELRAGG
ncbi:MAG: cobalamin-independent methionine synthase II family protein [Planctomycetes bacterium]|nr:cobalamin-independent methionine synthase II family protein [Planctomycetota bacterium]